MANTNYFYYVISYDYTPPYNNDPDFCGHMAMPIRVNESLNLMPILQAYNPVYVHQCTTIKQAVEIAYAWNEAYTKQGRFPKGFLHGNGKPIKFSVTNA